MRNSLFLLGLLIFTPSLGLSEPLFFSDDFTDSRAIADYRFGFSGLEKAKEFPPTMPLPAAPATREENKRKKRPTSLVSTVDEGAEDDPGALRVVRFLEEGMRSLLSYPFKPTVAEAETGAEAEDERAAPPTLEEIAARLQQYDERWPDGIEKF